MRLPFKPRRTALYLPAINARAVAKARTLPVDIVILDLEDAVAPERKEEARNAAVAAAQEGGFGDRELIIRANGLDTPWWRDDLVAAARSGADGVLVPKVGSAADIARCGELLRDAPAGLSLWAMIETCAAVVALPAIAAAAEGSRLAAMVLGTNDLAKEMRAALTPDRLAFLPILTSAVIAARAHGLIVLDGVCNDFQDIDRFEAECRQGLVLGFDGKTIIHPRQVDPCNAVYSPTPDEVRWAERIITAFDAPDHAGKGVVQIDGQMVERLHLDDARRVQATAAAIARRRDESVD
ncbi:MULTISPECIES: HpcH/HpaI aldolase/citrate lyase family protein [unclassified Sphingopyxis]|jgi:citrate lyase subunit beta/citryl-CoA lyase|uniref:HpcH/HpaI aldolase/citrate lyase family protein n=1 Tax=unclassified Sphingopyxis TaxID=2614943 RepID=UPI0008697470|nr:MULTISPECIES: CoA ester lyase [unclassified Sphingopyxis]AVA13351.1 CoA ester lyase [Sphingopyxis sp. MG]ODU28810.1 MAG: malyl-CoA thiolesterase [Sphingopyxis sp. SCN 67-31]